MNKHAERSIKHSAFIGCSSVAFHVEDGVKYLNNIVEQSHRWVKQKTRQALGWKSVEGATASLHGREMWTMLKRDQIDVVGETACERFYALAE